MFKNVLFVKQYFPPAGLSLPVGPLFD